MRCSRLQTSVAASPVWNEIAEANAAPTGPPQPVSSDSTLVPTTGHGLASHAGMASIQVPKQLVQRQSTFPGWQQKGGEAWQQGGIALGGAHSLASKQHQGIPPDVGHLPGASEPSGDHTSHRGVQESMGLKGACNPMQQAQVRQKVPLATMMCMMCFAVLCAVMCCDVL